MMPAQNSPQVDGVLPQPMKIPKATTPTNIAQTVTGPPPATRMEIPRILMPRPRPLAARPLLRGSTAYQ